MEYKDRKNHYLHPDFEDININNEKKPSPLALLAQTCKNVGSVKDMVFYTQNPSPASTNGFRKFPKRCRSDSSSNSSSTDRDYLSPMKKLRADNKNPKKKKIDVVELKNADTSSETSYNSGTSLISNLINFVKNSNNSQLVDADKIELINFLANQKGNKEKTSNHSSKTDCSKKGNQFNVEKGYHLDSNEESTNRGTNVSQQTYSPPIIHDAASGMNFSKTSAIKYCMYCGKLIPILPMLLAHIRLEHGNGNFPEAGIQTSFSPPQMPLMYEVFSKFNPYITSSDGKANQTFSFLADYVNSSFKGLNNLIC